MVEKMKMKSMKGKFVYHKGDPSKTPYEVVSDGIGWGDGGIGWYRVVRVDLNKDERSNQGLMDPRNAIEIDVKALSAYKKSLQDKPKWSVGGVNNNAVYLEGNLVGIFAKQEVAEMVVKKMNDK